MGENAARRLDGCSDCRAPAPQAGGGMRRQPEAENILIVDDDSICRAMLREMLQDAYPVHEAQDGPEALRIAADPDTRIAVILLDIMMPGMNGYEVLRRLKESPATRDIPVILITSLDSDTSECAGLRFGAIDYVTKPFVYPIVRRRVDNQVELKRHHDHLQELVDEKAGKLLGMTETLFDAVTSLIECRNFESGSHVKRMRLYCRMQLDHLLLRSQYYDRIGPKNAEIIVRASALHDIGKVGIPDNILLKPARLTPAEFEVMKTHTTIGSGFIDSLPGIEDDSYLAYAREICRSHHERWDGRGYPDGLAGDGIPLSARIVAVADVYDALVSRRVYKPPIPHGEAVGIILSEAGLKLDPALVACFMEINGQFRAAASEYADD